ncbi:hypothetical protein E4T45_01873 [Aureobasidium sp. EXF-8846]|nr:hypothetical protein E4T45_01873 [Aureobasidium sp. EXF-8846]
MPSSTPSFGDLEYWNKRFTKEDAFEWLADFTVLEPWLKREINGRSCPQVSHIGCGSSALSMQLRDLVGSPQQIHNVDYSEVVVEKNRQRYDMIVDKSTSDAISCSEDVLVALPYHFKTNGSSQVSQPTERKVYPLHVLAVNLAFLARPGCSWVVLSYSADRFSYWNDGHNAEGMPHPSELWRLERHEKIEQSPDPDDTVHRPPVMHHLYILRRTDVRLN